MEAGARRSWRPRSIAWSRDCRAGAYGRRRPAPPRPPSATASRREWMLTLLASLVWAAFNAAYVVFLSFAPRVLMVGGLGAIESASIMSLASWVMIFSGVVRADRRPHRPRGRHPLFLPVLRHGVAGTDAAPAGRWR